jgi:Holliday junction resolvase RusA-like endonuclease
MTFELELPIDVVISKKNNTVIRRRGKRSWIAPNHSCEVCESYIRTMAERVRHRSLGDDEIAMEVEWDVQAGVVTVRVHSLGPRPSGRRKTGRARDVINLPAILADALQGVVYDDDRQIKELTVRRRT